MGHRNNVNLSLFIQLAKVNNHKMNEKLSHEYQSRAEHVTGQINSHTLELLLRPFDFCIVSKILICFSQIKHFPSGYKRYPSNLQVSILHRVAPIKVFPP